MFKEKELIKECGIIGNGPTTGNIHESLSSYCKPFKQTW